MIYAKIYLLLDMIFYISGEVFALRSMVGSKSL